ncbi:MAG TPA: cytochrome c7 [Geobacteraceae bacterium]|nr:cytochrome c7 [Geobacteraceae bacterium]
MKKLVAAVMLLLSCAGISFAADVITFPAKMGDVKFPHKMHQQMVKDCKVCHTRKIGTIDNFGKDTAHKMCWDCHKAKGKGPVACKDCHKKK